MDETYYGGKEKNKHKDKRTENAQGRSTKTKTPVIGAITRQGNIVARAGVDTKSSTVKPFVKEHIHIAAEIKTDEYRSYGILSKTGYSHDTVDHGKGQFVKGNTHTNTAEGFCSQLKRSINGTYHFASPKYLQQYVNEFSYRDNRQHDITPIFRSLVSKAAMRVQ